MKLRKIISGGQVGADRTGLECAKALGLETGGTAPKGYRTDKGKDPSLADFGLKESPAWNYQIRTRDNVRDSEVTLWFGKTSSGYWCTKTEATRYGRPFYENPTIADLEKVCEKCEVVNIAGNRDTRNPAVNELVKDAFRHIAKILGKDAPNF